MDFSKLPDDEGKLPEKYLEQLNKDALTVLANVSPTVPEAVGGGGEDYLKFLKYKLQKYKKLYDLEKAKRSK